MIAVSNEWLSIRKVVQVGSLIDDLLAILLDVETEVVIGVDDNQQVAGYMTSKQAFILARSKEKIVLSHHFSSDYYLMRANMEVPSTLVDEYSYFIIVNENEELLGGISKNELKSRLLEERLSFLEGAIEHARIGVLAIDSKARIKVLNRRGREILENDGGINSVLNKPFLDFYDDPSILKVLEDEQEQLNRSYNFDNIRLMINRSPIYKDNKLTGVVSVYEDQKELEDKLMQLELITNLNKDLRAIVDSIYDEILVVDKDGTILRVSEKRNFNFWGVNSDEIIGQNIFELENKGWFKPSVTRYVVENLKKVSVIQETRYGKKILAVGNPIFNEEGELDRIVVASRDITEISDLKKELVQVKSQTERYKKEIELLRSPPKFRRDFVFCSDIMRDLFSRAEKMAKVDSTVLIYGESGVGKEVVAENIHHLSKRSEHPFIKVNCGAIPESLLESELFGYEKGAFTGALTKGKPGMFELANKGTLFLDEIGEIPLILQVKLLQAIQDLKIMRVGGSTQIPLDIRIIAATNKDLEELIEKNLFREDLYYRLAVIPLHVPALRERSEDIESIAFHFLENFNNKYQTSQHFSVDAIEVLKAYHWPGNVRELQNIVERAIVTISGALITAEELSSLIFHKKKKEKQVRVSSILPLKAAQDMLEEQLFALAMRKYKSTALVAKALEVSQPTAWRKIQYISKLREE